MTKTDTRPKKRPLDLEVSTPRIDKPKDTDRVRRIQMERLSEVFPDRDLTTLSYRDYPEVKRYLNWAESTFKTALSYLKCDTGNLRDGYRTYLPSDAEIETLKQVVDTDMIVTLTVVGCRFTELWNMSLSGDTLVVYTSKGGKAVILNLAGVSTATKRSIKQWVAVGSHKLTWTAARKR